MPIGRATSNIRQQKEEKKEISVEKIEYLHFTLRVGKFCYLGDMLSVDGDADAAVETRIRIGWKKFRQLVPLLTNEDISLTVRGRLYSSCVRSSMLHGSETWPVRKENEVALQRAEMRMVDGCVE